MSMESLHVGWFVMIFLQLLSVVSECSLKAPPRKIHGNASDDQVQVASSGLQLIQQPKQVIVDNGLVRVTLSKPGGLVTAIQYNGLDNVLETKNTIDDRGYWDITWSAGPSSENTRVRGTIFKVVKQDQNQIELSFVSSRQSGIPLNVDKRYVFLRGVSGYYMYAIYERLKGWPALNIGETRIVFKPQDDMFNFMAMSDERQRIMPTDKDRANGRQLDYPEAVLLTNPTNPKLKGEVDDKYQYSCDDKENRVHGWISSNLRIGFWMITPSNEFRTSGPFKQDLTSHTGPTTLSMFMSGHYAGTKSYGAKFQNGEPWKKVFGPVFVYLNSVPRNQNPYPLWNDAKQQMLKEVESWPYNFLESADLPASNSRGIVSGQLQVHDRYVNPGFLPAANGYVGLALPGDVGSWQRETKGYQFWVQADTAGNFLIKNVRAGVYNLYASVPGFIGDYKYKRTVTVTPGCNIKLGTLVYNPPRDGPTLWEIGVADRTAAEFNIPSVNPMFKNFLYERTANNKFRQYGLWERYAELYPHNDLNYTVGSSNYTTDWFYAHVTRKTGFKEYKATTWQILFQLKNVITAGTYRLRIALASSSEAKLQVRVNNPSVEPPTFTTGLMGSDNAIARHGIHGLYRLFNIDLQGSLLNNGDNTIYLRQPECTGPFEGLMYDYIRFEGPPR